VNYKYHSANNGGGGVSAEPAAGEVGKGDLRGAQQIHYSNIVQGALLKAPLNSTFPVQEQNQISPLGPHIFSRFAAAELSRTI